MAEEGSTSHLFLLAVSSLHGGSGAARYAHSTGGLSLGCHVRHSDEVDYLIDDATVH